MPSLQIPRSKPVVVKHDWCLHSPPRDFALIASSEAQALVLKAPVAILIAARDANRCFTSYYSTTFCSGRCHTIALSPWPPRELNADGAPRRCIVRQLCLNACSFSEKNPSNLRVLISIINWNPLFIWSQSEPGKIFQLFKGYVIVFNNVRDPMDVSRITIIDIFIWLLVPITVESQIQNWLKCFNFRGGEQCRGITIQSGITRGRWNHMAIEVGKSR